jgi:hypothetical protein
MVPHQLPDLEALDKMLHDLPLAVRTYTDEAQFYNVMMAIPPGYAFPGGPIRLQVCVGRLLQLCQDCYVVERW